MDLITQYRELARYNAWMNSKLYAVCAALGDEQRKRDLGAFFRSVHGTLNHLLVTDRVQLGRFVGAERTKSLDARGKEIAIRSLDQELYADFGELRREREKTDALIVEWTARELTAEFLGRTLEYDAMSAPGRFAVPMWAPVSHFFNHQTHHRGQVTTLLMQLGHDPGVTDFMAMLRVQRAPQL
jgi:uncharacterized damage-inducible protein DinB